MFSINRKSVFKAIILCVFFGFPMIAFAQKIKISEYDKFIKKYRIETNSVAIKQGLANGLGLGLRSIDTTVFLVVSGYGRSTGVVGKKDRMIFLLSDDTTVEVLSKDIQSYRIGQYQNSFSHDYYIATVDVERLKTATVKSIRIYNSEGYVDTDIKTSDAKDINKLCDLFSKEFNHRKK